MKAVDFTGWDPYDALASPVLRTVARGRFSQRAIIQALKRSPINIRPVLGVPPLPHTKGLALFTSAFARLASVGVPRAADIAVALARRLQAVAIRDGEHVGWGYDFDVVTRWGLYRRGEPNAVVTAFVAHALLDAAAIDQTLDRLVPGVLRYARERLAVDDGSDVFFGYYRGSTVPVHNANVLIASVAARAGVDEIAAAAMEYTVGRQRSDGSWPYGEATGLEWVDGFHTAYVLEALGRWHAVTGDDAVDRAVRLGLGYYLTHLVDEDGAARATAASRYPLEAHAAASAVTALTELREYDQRAMLTATRIVAWALKEMRRRDGRFAFQRHRLYRNSIPYIRWSDGHMLLALANYLLAMNG